MKNFTILFFLLFVFASCNMERRLYRDGWYVERSRPLAEQRSSQAASGYEDPKMNSNRENNSETQTPFLLNDLAAEPSGSLPDATSETAVSNVNAPVKKQFHHAKDDDPKPKMRYAEARKSMAEKGCEPDPLVITTYYMALATVFTIWFGLGFLFLLLTFLLSIFAMERAVKSGECADENIAIVRDARRICGMIFLWFLAIGILVAAFVLAIIKIVAENGGM